MKVYKDLNGNRVWFPKGKKWYFDKALNRRFYSVKEKAEFMNSHGIYKNTESRLNKVKDGEWDDEKV